MDSSSSLKSAQYHPPSGSHSSYPSIPPSQTSMNYRSSARLLQNDMNGGGSGGAAGSYPVHPDVRLKPLPFYDIMADLMRPTSLVPANNSRFQESRFIFHLTPQQAQDIAMSR
ncbi:PIAS2 (predicted) [Pycnogonum litorale]